MLRARVRRWRNWYTRQLEVLVGATPWKFESSSPHHSSFSKLACEPGSSVRTAAHGAKGWALRGYISQNL